MPQIPTSLIIPTDSVISVDMDSPLGFYPREDYLLVEITNKIKIWDTRKLIANYSKDNNRPVVIRAIGRSINTAVVMIHLMRTDQRSPYADELNAQTFSAQHPNSSKLITGIQFILFPK